MGKGLRVQATSKFTQFLSSETRFFLSSLRGALRPQKTVLFFFLCGGLRSQKPYGLLGMGEEWDKA